MADLDESVDREERIKALQGQIDEMKKLQRDEQQERRKALLDQIDEMGSLPRDELKNAIQEQVEEIKRLHIEEQERQKALREQIVELKRLEKAEQKENKKGLRLGLVLKLGKTCDWQAKNDRVNGPGFLQDLVDAEDRKGFLKMHILGVLAEGPSHGYEIMHRIGHHTGHMWKPSPGSMYPALETLESKGFISCQGDGRRKVYSLAPKGQNVLDQIRKKQEEQFLEMKAFMTSFFNE